MPKLHLSDKERLGRHVKINPETGCWEWSAHRCRKQGYGKTCLGGKSFLAHRAMWTVHNGQIPPGADVLHRCDNPPCCNPDHLFLGDDFVNQRDRVAKGRHKGVPRNQRGEENKMAKLSEKEVLKIREIYATGRVSQRAIGLSYGVGQGLVSQIITRKIWSHI